jgi:hypothetical protein
MAKHTPGPWKLEASTNPFEGYMIYGANNKPIGSTFLADGDELTPGDEASAALLAAAPDLLEVLRHALWADICPCCGRDNTGLSQRCTSDDCPGVQAIAKAEGS